MEEKQAAQNRMIHVLASRHPRPKLGQEEFCHQTRLRGEKAHPRRKPQERHPPRHPHSVPCSDGPGPQRFGFVHEDVARRVLSTPAAGR